MSTDTQTVPPVVVGEAVVRVVERLSPSFVRITFGGPGIAGFGTEGSPLDQRIKILLPDEHGDLPAVARDAGWYSSWLELPEDRRGVMRTYTLRRTIEVGDETMAVVDFVLHPAHAGPASQWAEQAGIGDRLLLIGPRQGIAWGGVEFAPGDASELLLVGDETALPAIASILESLAPGTVGHAFVEVPTAADQLEVQPPSGFGLTWLPRDAAGYGERLTAAVRDHLGLNGRAATVAPPPPDDDPAPWETPTYSSSGEEVTPAAQTTQSRTTSTGRDGLYAWIAGEASLVTGLRRAMVREAGFDRGQVAFMGYWKRGVALS